jgi:hypothetical protein
MISFFASSKASSLRENIVTFAPLLQISDIIAAFHEAHKPRAASALDIAFPKPPEPPETKAVCETSQHNVWEFILLSVKFIGMCAYFAEEVMVCFHVFVQNSMHLPK